MPSLSPDDVLGFEYDWLAFDADGNVALFTTAGGGFAPAALLASPEAQDASIDAALSTPSMTRPTLAPDLPPGRDNTWRRLAERGFFGFDSSPNGGPYRKVAAPVRPIRVRELPGAVAGSMVALDVRFATADEVQNEPIRRATGGPRAVTPLLTLRNCDNSGRHLQPDEDLPAALGALYDQLADADREHSDVAVTDEGSAWTLSAHRDGRVVLEHLDSRCTNRHMHPVSRDAIIDLWARFVKLGLGSVWDEPWRPGYV